MHKRLLLASLAMAVSANAAFLDDLAADARKVDSSPYATGGDVILKVSDCEYIHVFTNTASAATFNPSSYLKAWVLAVGGGGGAYASNSQRPGGGGGGGFVEALDVAFTAGSYEVIVGAGGTRNGGTGVGGTGGSSSINNLTALGGGGGGCGKAGADGASGGGGSGGSAQYNGGQATGDNPQGFAGQSGTSICGGGGGGAGGMATAVISLNTSDPKMHPSHGGPGRSSLILGYEQYFGGGGGGSRANNYWISYGGIGGGGNGGAGSSADQSDIFHGEGGLGGGGGGVYQPSNSGKGGTGGSGIVIVRYCATDRRTPLLGDVDVSFAGGKTLSVSGTLLYSGSSAATVTAVFWPADGSEGGEGTVTETVGGAETDTAYAGFSTSVSSLAFDTVYSYRVYASNASGNSASVSGTASTASATLGETARLSDGTVLSPAISGIDRVYTFSASGTFTVAEGRTGLANILLVGGGGAGGGAGGGGGGGGGVRMLTAVPLSAGSYQITVGSGGVHSEKIGSEDESAKGVGGASSFGDVASVSGGGAGMTPDRPSNNSGNDNTAGASSAGGSAGARAYSLNGIDGEGNAGGDFKNTSSSGMVNGAVGGSGGGGGAGGAGERGSATSGGAGGAGAVSMITGESVLYGAGGGGTIYYLGSGTTGGAGGAGGGGDGGSYDSLAGSNGTFYGAGGGAGGLTSSNTRGWGGDGADGVVIVRVSDFSSLGDNPVISLDAISGETADEATFSVSVPYAGASSDTVSVIVEWGFEEGDYSAGRRVLATEFSGSADIPFSGLLPATAYYVRLTADDGNGHTATAAASFTTVGSIADNVSATSSGVVTYTVERSCSTARRVVLLAGSSAGELSVVETYSVDDNPELLAYGTHWLSRKPESSEIGTTVYYAIRLESEVDGKTVAQTSNVASATAMDIVTYDWESSVTDGYWCDSENWTSNGGIVGWPSTGATAHFRSTVGTVRVDRAVSLSTTQFDSSAMITFVGENPSAEITTGSSGDSPIPFGPFVFESITVNWSAGQNGFLGTRVMTLRNGTTFNVPSKAYTMTNAGGNLTVEGGSVFKSGSLGGHSGSCVTLADGKIIANWGVNFSERGSADKPPMDLYILSASSRIETGGNFYSQYTDATVTVYLEKAAYDNALIVETGSTVMAASGGKLTFSVPMTKKGKKLEKCDILVADWSKKSINFSNVAFGEHEERNDCYFYYTDAAGNKYVYSTESGSETSLAAIDAPGTPLDTQPTVTKLWYHHEGPPGFVIRFK